MKKQYIIPIIISNNKCKNNCEFCNQKVLNKETSDLTKEDVRNAIEEHLKSVKEDSKVEVAFIGGCFTALENEKQQKLLEETYKYIKLKKIQSIRVSVAPNHINKSVLKKLKKYKVKTIEIYVPSSNDYILRKSEANYIFKDVKRSSRLIRLQGMNLGYQMMIGLPDSTYLDDINTAKDLIKLKPKMVRFFIILVLKGTKLEEAYKKGEYKELTLVQAVETCKELMKLFVKKNIEITRIEYGNGISNKEIVSDIIAGPYHAKFRNLVESGIWYDAIVAKIKKLNIKVKEVVVTVNSIDFDNAIGVNDENIKKLKDLYDVNLIVKKDDEVKQGKSKIEVTKTYGDNMG